MISCLFYAMIVYYFPNNLPPIMTKNFQQISTLNNSLLFVHVDIPLLSMYKWLLIIHLSIIILEHHPPVTLLIICINWHHPSPPHHDNPPCPLATTYYQHRPPLKIVEWHRHRNHIPSPIRLAPQVSQELRKPQVPSTLGSSLLSLLWVDLSTDSFCTHTETSPTTSSLPDQNLT